MSENGIGEWGAIEVRGAREKQRTKMVRHLGASLTDVTCVFDEPTIGHHAHDVQQMNGLLQRLRDKGNTVLVVEHEPEVIRVADHVVDMGPGAGQHGGEVVFQGPFAELSASGTLTARHLDVQQTLKETVRTPTGHIQIRNARLHNLQACRSTCRSVSSWPSRRGRLGEELAHPRLHAADRSIGHRRRPVGHPRFPPLEPGHLHRHP